MSSRVALFSDAGEAAEDDETALIVATQRDPTAFGVIYQRHAGQIYSYLRERTSMDGGREAGRTRVRVPDSRLVLRSSSAEMGPGESACLKRRSSDARQQGEHAEKEGRNAKDRKREEVDRRE